jgi:hypothetical protein
VRQTVLKFDGPYWWFGESERSILHAPVAQQRGLYLWTIATSHCGELIYYVGETGREFRLRFAEHLKEQLSGAYRLNDPAAMLGGVRTPMWPGLYGPLGQKSLADFVDSLPSLAPALKAFVQTVRFHVAIFDGDSRLRKRIEAAIADHLYAQPAPVGTFHETDIRYDPRRPAEAAQDVAIASTIRLEGLPELVTA